MAVIANCQYCGGDMLAGQRHDTCRGRYAEDILARLCEELERTPEEAPFQFPAELRLAVMNNGWSRNKRVATNRACTAQGSKTNPTA